MIYIEEDKNKRNKKESIEKERRIINRNAIIWVLVIIMGFCIVICKLYNIMFVKGEEYKLSANNQHTKDQVISPNRGIIYDANGEVLAKSVVVKTISVNPGQISYYNGKKVEPSVIAKGISDNLELDYNEVLSKISTESSVVVIAKKVEEKKAEQLEKWLSEQGISKGVNIDEDIKRYYPYSSLASNLIGFCGDDNTGIIGIEENWNSKLKGVAGKIVTTQDVNKKAISDENEQYIPVENGNNIYLTIDITIQQIVEKYLKQAVEENNCTGGRKCNCYGNTDWKYFINGIVSKL